MQMSNYLQSIHSIRIKVTKQAQGAVSHGFAIRISRTCLGLQLTAIVDGRMWLLVNSNLYIHWSDLSPENNDFYPVYLLSVAVSYSYRIKLCSSINVNCICTDFAWKSKIAHATAALTQLRSSSFVIFAFVYIMNYFCLTTATIGVWKCSSILFMNYDCVRFEISSNNKTVCCSRTLNWDNQFDFDV